MEIKEMQKQASDLVNDVYNKIGALKDDETIFLHLIEEIGEISRQLVNPKLKRDKINVENLKEELADAILLISQLANNHNIDLEEAFKNKINKLKQRHDLK